MKYYLHDASSFDDEKITELYLKFGYEGLGLFYTALEKFAKQEKPIKTSVLKAQLNVGKRLEKCWRFMEEIGMIQSSNGDSFNERLLNYGEMYQIKKEKTRKKVAEWREKQKDIKDVTGYVPVSNPPKVKESKVKESKVNKEEFDLQFLDVRFIPVFMEWIDYKKSRNEKYKTQKSLEACYRNLLRLANNNPDQAKLLIDQAMGNNWAGIFPLKTTGIKKDFGIPDKERDYITPQKF